MATALERVMSGPAPAEVVKEHKRRPAALLYGPLAVVLAVGGAVVARDAGGQVGQWVRVSLVIVWAVAGMVATRRRPEEQIGPLALRATAIGALASMCASLLAANGHGSSRAERSKYRSAISLKTVQSDFVNIFAKFAFTVCSRVGMCCT